MKKRTPIKRTMEQIWEDVASLVDPIAELNREEQEWELTTGSSMPDAVRLDRLEGVVEEIHEGILELIK